jgi:integrase
MPDSKKKEKPKKAKSANGEGAMSFLEDKKLYCYRVTIGTDSAGKPIRKAFYGKTKKETRDKGIAAQARLMQGQAAVSSDMKVSEWADKWLENYKSGLSPRTIENYKNIMYKQIIPSIGNYQLKNLKQMYIQKNDYRTRKQRIFLIHGKTC